MTSLEHVEWGACLLHPRHDPELERNLRRRAGTLPPMVPYFEACPWLAEALVELNEFEIRLLESDVALADLIGLVVPQDNSCRYCFAAQRALLREKYPDKGFLPTELGPRAQVVRWLLFAATELEQPLWRISRNTFLYPEEQRQPADVVIASREFKEMAAVLDEHLRGREFLVSDAATVADFVIAYTLDWGDQTQLLGDFPQLRAYMERMCARPNAAPRIAEAFASIQA